MKKNNKVNNSNLENEDSKETVNIDRVKIKKLVNEFPGQRKNLITDSQISARTFDRLVDTKVKSKVNKKTVKSLAKALKVPFGDLITGEDIAPSVSNLEYIKSFAGHPGLDNRQAVCKFYNCTINKDNSNLFKTIMEFMYTNKKPRKVANLEGPDEILRKEIDFINSLAEPNTALDELEKQGIRMYLGEYDAFYIAAWTSTEPEQRENKDFDPDVHHEEERFEIVDVNFNEYYPVYSTIKIVAFFESRSNSIQVKINNGYGSSEMAINAYKEFVTKNLEKDSIKKMNNYEKILETIEEIGVFNNTYYEIKNFATYPMNYNYFFSTKPRAELLKYPEFKIDLVYPRKSHFSLDEFKEIKKKEETMN